MVVLGVQVELAVFLYHLEVGGDGVRLLVGGFCGWLEYRVQES